MLRITEVLKKLKMILINPLRLYHTKYWTWYIKKEICKRTLYNYVGNGYLDIINLDLPRKVRYKNRKHNNTNTHKKDTKIRINCTYENFKG